MMPAVLWQTTLDPAQRSLLRVVNRDEAHTDKVLSELLGRDVQARYRFIVERAKDVEELDV